MKKILAIAIVAIMAVALCTTAFAAEMTSFDQITTVAGAGNDPSQNLGTFGGNNAAGTDLGDISEKVSAGEDGVIAFYLWGWYTTGDAKIVEFGYRFGDVKVLGSAKYETGQDVINAGAPIAGETGESSRFQIKVPVVKGENVEAFGIVKLENGEIRDIAKVTYTSTVGVDSAAQQQGGEPTNPGTADAAVIAIAAVACIALAGVVVAKKVK